jgi:hypothetical protein
MGSALENLGVSAGINLGLAAIFVACYSVASRLPINTRVYFPALFQVRFLLATCMETLVFKSQLKDSDLVHCP